MTVSFTNYKYDSNRCHTVAKYQEFFIVNFKCAKVKQNLKKCKIIFPKYFGRNNERVKHIIIYID